MREEVGGDYGECETKKECAIKLTGTSGRSWQPIQLVAALDESCYCLRNCLLSLCKEVTQNGSQGLDEKGGGRT